MEWIDHQGPCDTGEDIYASAQTTKEECQRPLPDQWRGNFRVRFEVLIDEGLKGRIDCQMYFRIVLGLSRKMLNHVK